MLAFSANRYCGFFPKSHFFSDFSPRALFNLELLTYLTFLQTRKPKFRVIHHNHHHSLLDPPRTSTHPFLHQTIFGFLQPVCMYLYGSAIIFKNWILFSCRMKNNGFVGWRNNFPGKKKKCQKNNNKQKRNYWKNNWK